MRLRTSPFLTDVILTTLTSVVSSAGVLITTRLLAQGLGQSGFGTYSISRRILATLVPLTTLGVGLAIPRCIAVARDRNHVKALLLAGAFLGVVPSVLVLAVGALGAGPLASVLFRDASQSGALVATLLGVIGYSAYTVVYGYYQGRGRMIQANGWQLLVIAIGPVLVAWAFATRETVTAVLFWMAAVYLVALGPLAYLLGVRVATPAGELRAAGRELYEYGGPRIGMGVLFAAIFAIGPLLAPYVGSTEDAGFIAAGQSVIGLASTAISAFALVSLPKVAQLVSEGREGFLRERVSDLVALIVHVGLFMAIQLLVWSDLLTTAWLGPDYAPAIPLMRTLMVAVLPYSAFELLRSVVDAVEKRPVNTVNLGWALLTTVAGSGLAAALGQGVRGLAVATAAGMAILGVLTVRHLRLAGWLGPVSLRAVQVGAFNLMAAVAALLSRRWVLSTGSSVGGVMRALVVETVLFGIYWLFLRRLSVRWVRQIEERMIQGDPPN